MLSLSRLAVTASVAAALSVPAAAQARPVEGGIHWDDQVPASLDKASAVREYCARRGIAAESVVAFGDGPNDLGLLAFAGTSIAPANARPEVAAAATWITRSNDDDGVAWALRVLVP